MGTKMSDTAVYVIWHVSGRAYVGSTSAWRRREGEHFSMLRQGTHVNAPLQNAWNKYGGEEFFAMVLERPPTSQLIAREQRWIDLLDAAVSGYNICPAAGTRRGVPHSPEHRAKISAAKMGHRQSEATKARIREARANQVMRPEAMAKTHAAVRGRPRSAEVRAKIAAGHVGKVLSEATRAKIAAANQGKRDSPETRARKSASAKAWRAKQRGLDAPEYPPEGDDGEN